MCNSQNCLSGQKFTLGLSNTKNPSSAPSVLDPITVQITSPDKNPIYKCPDLFDATPVLEIGPLFNLKVTHHDSRHTKEASEYSISFTTSAEITSGGSFLF